MANKAKKLRVVTPVGTAKYAWLNRPDNKYVKAGEYKVDLLVDEDEMAELTEQAEAFLAEYVEAVRAGLTKGGKAAKAKKLSVAPAFIEDTDPQTGEPTGKMVVRAKLRAVVTPETGEAFKQKPQLLDARGKELPESAIIYSGSTGRIGIELVPYYSAKDNEAGLTKRLKVFQVEEIKQSAGGFDMGALGSAATAGNESMDDSDDDDGDVPFDMDDGGDFY